MHVHVRKPQAAADLHVRQTWFRRPWVPPVPRTGGESERFMSERATSYARARARADGAERARRRQPGSERVTMAAAAWVTIKV